MNFKCFGSIWGANLHCSYGGFWGGGFWGSYCVRSPFLVDPLGLSVTGEHILVPRWLRNSFQNKQMWSWGMEHITHIQHQPSLVGWPIIRPITNTKTCLLPKTSFSLIFKTVLLQQGCLCKPAFMLLNRFLLGWGANVRIKQFSCKQISTLDRF